MDLKVAILNTNPMADQTELKIGTLKARLHIVQYGMTRDTLTTPGRIAIGRAHNHIDIGLR